jgi:preprotein translocase subunit SecG
MENVVLAIHLIIALAIIGLVLLQRSSGGGLGIGGGSGGLGDFATARSTANALTKATTFLAIMFFATSLTLGILAKNKGADKSGELFTQPAAEITIEEGAEAASDIIDDALQMGEEAVNDAVKEVQETIPEVPSEKE